MRHFLCFTLSILMLSTLSGCASWFSGPAKDPKIELVKVEVERARLTDQLFHLYFRIDNPNSFSIPVRGLGYNVHLNGMKLASGESSDWFTVPAYSRHTVKVPVRTNLWRHLKDMVRLLEKPHEPIQYQLQAQIKIGLLFGHQVQLLQNGEIIPGNFIPE